MEALEDAIRLLVDTSSTEPMEDVITSATPDTWRGNSLRVEFALFKGRGASKQILSVLNYTSLLLEVKAEQSVSSAALMSKELALVDLDDTCTAETFDNGTKQHGVFEFTYVETNLTFTAGEKRKKFWMVLSAVGAGDRRITLGCTTLTMIEDGTAPGGAAPEIGDPSYYNTTESDARFVNVTGDDMFGSLVINGSDAGLILNDDAAHQVALLPEFTSFDSLTHLRVYGAGFAWHGSSVDQIMISLQAVGTGPSDADRGLKVVSYDGDGESGNGTLFAGTVSLSVLSAGGVPLCSVGGTITGTATTSNLPEGSNLYFTNARADARIAAARGAANGIASLDSSSKIPLAQLPAVAISEYLGTVATTSGLLALLGERGDWAIVTADNTTYILTTDDPTDLAHWKQIATPVDVVLSVNGNIGAVSLDTDDIPEGSNLYFTGARVVSTTLSGLSFTNTAIVNGDDITEAFGKAQGQITARLALAGGTMTGAILLATTASPQIAFTGDTSLGFFRVSSGIMRFTHVDGTFMTLDGPSNSTAGSVTLDCGMMTIAGSSTGLIEQKRATSGAGVLLTIGGGSAQSGGTNLAGGELALNAGYATGSGSSHVKVYAAGGFASGTADRRELYADFGANAVTISKPLVCAAFTSTGNISFFGATAASQQTSGANLTNNVTSGGTTDQIADISLPGFAGSDTVDLGVLGAAFGTVRDDLYQLARKLKQVNDALRVYGLLT